MPGASRARLPQPGPLQEITKSPDRRVLSIPLAGSQRPLQPLRVLLGVPSHSEQGKSLRRQVITGDHTQPGEHPASIAKPRNTDKVSQSKTARPAHRQAERALSCPSMWEGQGPHLIVLRSQRRGKQAHLPQGWASAFSCLSPTEPWRSH